MQELLSILLRPQVIYSAAILILTAVLWSVNTHFYKKYMKLSDGIYQTDSPRAAMAGKVFTFTRYLLLIMAILTLLQINGMNISSILAGLGIVSIVVGLAVQELLRDIIAGIQIISDRFFKVGDVVRYGDLEGIVVFFDLRCTKIQSLETRSVTTVSNRNISEITLVSDTVTLDIPLPYTLNSLQSKQVMTHITQELDQIDGISSCMNRGIQEFAASSVNWRISFICDPKERFTRKLQAYECIYDALEKEGVSIPFSQLDVHLSQKEN